MQFHYFNENHQICFQLWMEKKISDLRNWLYLSRILGTGLLPMSRNHIFWRMKVNQLEESKIQQRNTRTSVCPYLLLWKATNKIDRRGFTGYFNEFCSYPLLIDVIIDSHIPYAIFVNEKLPQEYYKTIHFKLYNKNDLTH